MTKTIAVPAMKPAGGYTVGCKGFAKISALEGVRLSPRVEVFFREFDEKGLSAKRPQRHRLRERVSSNEFIRRLSAVIIAAAHR